MDGSKGIKIILLGDSGVGKTNLINVCVGQSFNADSKPTNCCSLLTKPLEIKNNKYKINLWDTMGQEAYKGISKLFFREAQIVIFVYDITHIEDWIQMANETINEDYICGIVGNKNDLYLQAEVNEEEAKKYAESKKMKFKLVSAKEDPQSFDDFLVELVKMFKIPENKVKTVLNKNPVVKTKKCC